MSGEGEIRTPATLAGRPVFETGAFNRSATSPATHARDGRGCRKLADAAGAVNWSVSGRVLCDARDARGPLTALQRLEYDGAGTFGKRKCDEDDDENFGAGRNGRGLDRD